MERQNGDRKHLVQSLDSLGRIERDQRKPAQARAAFTEALAVVGEIGWVSQKAVLLSRLADLDRRAADLGSARKQYQESTAIAQEAEGPRERAVRLDNQARILARDGDLAGARRMYEEALALKRTVASPASRRMTTELLATLVEHQGDLREARRMRTEFCESARSSGTPRTVWSCELNLASLSLLEGDAEAALRALLPLGERASGTSEVALVNRKIAAARRAMGQIEEAARAIGRSLDVCAADPDAPAVECLRVKIEAARVANERGQTAEATLKADQALAEAGRNQIMAYALEARLVQAEIAVKAKDPAAVRKSEEVARDADRMGFKPIALAARKLKLVAK